MAGERTSVSIDDLIAELQMYRVNLGGTAAVVVFDETARTTADVIDVYAERGTVYLQSRPWVVGVKAT